MSKISLELTVPEYRLLLEAMESVQDEGPSSAGWKSPEMSRLEAKVESLQEEYALVIREYEVKERLALNQAKQTSFLRKYAAEKGASE